MVIIIIILILRYIVEIAYWELSLPGPVERFAYSPPTPQKINNSKLYKGHSIIRRRRRILLIIVLIIMHP
jgi:hypothetical protein